MSRPTPFAQTCLAKLFALVLLAVVSANTPALDPIQGYRAPAAQVPFITLARSRIADQVLVQNLPQSIKRGTLDVEKFLAYRERHSGKVLATRSGEDPGPILNPEHPYLPPAIPPSFPNRCFTSRLGSDGMMAWARYVPHVMLPFPGLSCRTIVEGENSSWIHSVDKIQRLGVNGQTLSSVDRPLAFDANLIAANIDPATEDLLIVQQVASQAVSIRRIGANGMQTTLELPGPFVGSYFRELQQTPSGEWRALLKRSDDPRPWILRWNPANGALLTLPWSEPLQRNEERSRIVDVRWLDDSMALVLVQVQNVANARLLVLSETGAITQIAEETQVGVVERLYPIQATLGGAKHILATWRTESNQRFLTIRLLLGTSILSRRDVPVAAEHQLSAIGDSGEFLLAERHGSTLDISLMNESGQVLERGSVSIADVPARWFLAYAQDGGHFRASHQRTDESITSTLARHSRAGDKIWEQSLSGYITASDSDTRGVCVSLKNGTWSVQCFAMNDGQPAGNFPEPGPGCIYWRGGPLLRNDKLYLGDCALEASGQNLDLNKRAVLLAPERWRAPNGDVLWATSGAVRRLSADGTVLNAFGDGVFQSARSPAATPLRLLSDGGYVLARALYSDGKYEVEVSRINQNGFIVWQHREQNSALSPIPIRPQPLPREPLQVVGNSIHLRTYLYEQNPSRPWEFDQARTIVLSLSDGQVNTRHNLEWGERLVVGNSLIETLPDRVVMRAESGSETASFAYDGRSEPENPLLQNTYPVDLNIDSPITHRIFGGRLQINGQEYLLPDAVPHIRVDQDALDGSWTTQAPGRLLDRQGIVLDFLERDHLLFGAWFLFAPESSWEEAGLQWLTLSGTVDAQSRTAQLGIYRTSSGQFDAPPIVSAVQIGTAELELDSCSTGVLRYHFDQGALAGRSGTLIIRQLAPQANGCAQVGQSTLPLPEQARFGFTTRQSGGYYEPGLDGQGIMLQVRPELGPSGTLFGTWFTFDPAGAANDVDAQHWLTLQGTLADAVNGRVRVAIVRANGGEPIDDEQAFAHAPSPVIETVVGEAWVSFVGCGQASIDYRFDQSELAGAFSGRTGTMNLTKPYDCSH